VHRFIIGALLLAQQFTPQCGSSSSSTTDVNTVPVVVNSGPAGNSNNVPYVSVTVCVPGQTNNCQTIGGVLVDTGSSGLRLLGSALTLPLTQQTSGGAGINECFPFQDGFTWGPVANANVTIGSKTASNVPLQIVGGAGAPAPPPGCTSMGLSAENTLDSLGGNGVLGVGLFRQDCGIACSVTGSSNPGLYYACASGTCSIAAQSVTQQLQNPVWMFPNDNNGVVLQLASVAVPGQASAAGTLIFGIGTQSNNSLGSANVFTLDGNGNFQTTFGSSTTTGFIDAGSNGYYFLDSTAANIPTCTDNKDFYCPASTLNLTATNRGFNGRTNAVNFSVANTDTLPNLAVLPQLGGTFPGFFDWGLPFFYGRTVFTAIEGQSTPGGTGPYFAY
jgi:hypothetical protein